ncbi:hypothetical protein NLI96_g8734 [Meripilus lineatus]|uniref:F-box domain-containing protein n=1 Tax=Meripilus lineatus TaxID=2056292 RepID=A0AAD5YAW3_9APHY|nr:hypothetical protein NLI96_g8734 [Physisporinus lineatus]
MGLPVELWYYVVGFLTQDAMSLLACALTCRLLCDPAQRMIDRLHSGSIDASKYDDLNKLVEEIRNSPGHPKAIHQLDIEGWSMKTGPVALSVIPIRLSRQLMALRQLTLKDFDSKYQVHPSTWFLFGRAFPSVIRLVLSSIQFPSFRDFVVFVTSFPALIALELSGIRLRSRIIPIGVARSYNKRKSTLQELGIRDETGSFFLAAFVQWLVRREVQVRRLNITEWVASVPCQRLVSHFRGHLQDFTLQYSIRGAYTIEEVQQLHGSAGEI